MSQLHIAYRPETLKEFIGNDDIKSSLQPFINNPASRPRTYLFLGPSGCGKTTLGRLLSKAYGIHPRDYREYDLATTRGIDTVREVRASMSLHPMFGKEKLYLFDEIHGQTGSAQEAMLKMAEEPPDFVYFVFCTSEPENIKTTFKRRCATFSVKQLKDNEIMSLLDHVLGREGVTDYPKNLKEAIIANSGGSPGIALQILNSVIDNTDDKNALSVINDYSQVYRAYWVELVNLLLYPKKKGKEHWLMLTQIIKGNELTDPEKTRQYIIITLANNLMKGTLHPQEYERIEGLMTCFGEPLHHNGKAGFIYSVYNASKI